MFYLILTMCFFGAKECGQVVMPAPFKNVTECNNTGKLNVKKQSTPNGQMIAYYVCIERSLNSDFEIAD